ncbi:MFS transporter [Propionibacteriaceae bacterium Y1923]
MPEHPTRRPPWRRGALGQRGYPLYLLSMVQGSTGFWISKIAQDWLLLRLTGDVQAVGISTALQFAPVLFFGLYGGVLADKFNAKWLVVLAQAMTGMSALAMAVLAISERIAPWHVFIAATWIGFANVIDQPGRARIITALSGRYIGQAISLNSIAFQVSGSWGPLVSAAVVGAFGPGWAFAINATACLVSCLLLARLPVDDPPGRTVEKVGLREGLATIRQTTEIGWALALLACIAVLGLNMPLIYAGMANEVFHTGVEGYSQFNSLAAVGAVTGGLIAARRRGTSRLRELATWLGLYGLVLVLTSQAEGPLVFGLFVIAINTVVVLFQLLANTLVQANADPVALGRVMSLFTLVTFGGNALGGPLIGGVVDLIGPRATLALNGTLLLVAMVLTSLAIGRFTGQRLRIGPRGLVIIEPEVPRHVRLGLPPRRRVTPDDDPGAAGRTSRDSSP